MIKFCPNCKSPLTEKETSLEATPNGLQVSMKGIPLYYCETCQSYHVYSSDFQPAFSLLKSKQSSQIKPETYLYTLREVADVLRVSKQTIYNMIWDGRLKGQKTGREWRISAAELENFQNK